MKSNPAVILESEPQWLHPLQVGPATLLALASDPATFDAVTAVLERLLPDAYVDHMRRYYAAGRERFGVHWNYADQLTVLHAAARALRPRSYLEIGVFRGRSLSVVAAAAPDCALHAFDLWIAGYAGLDNAGPDLVREQLRRVGHRGALHVESGDSHETVPRFLEQHPDLGFDLVTVDGDHTEEGARRDLETVLPRINMGGALVFDDIRHPDHPWLERVWDDTVGALPSFACAKFVEVGSGVAVAIRRDPDDAVIASLRGDGPSRIAQLAHALEELRAKRVERIQVLETEMERRLELIQRQGTELGRIPGLESDVSLLRAQLQISEDDRAARLHVIEKQCVLLERVPTLEAEIARLQEQIASVEADRAKRLEVIEEQGVQLDRIPTLEAEIARLQEHVEFAEADRAKRLQVIEEQGTRLDRIPALEAEIARLQEHVEFAEADRAKRLQVIEEQGTRLDRIPTLEAEIARLQEHVEFAEADRAKRLQVIEEQGARLGRIPGLEAEIIRLREQVERAATERASHIAASDEQGLAPGRVPALEAEIIRLREQLHAAEIDRARHLDSLTRVNEELGRLRASLAEQLAILQTWVTHNMSGLLQRRHARAILTLLGEAALRLGAPNATAGANGTTASPTGDAAVAAPATPAPTAAPHLSHDSASNPRPH